jgi:dTMP kinase
MYLGGEFGRNPSDVNAYAASTLFAVDRVASYLAEWRADYQASDVFVADRYTTSNLIHQLSKLPEPEWEGFAAWLLDFEFGKLGLPRPDAVVYLRVDTATSQRLLASRYGGDASKRDVHERDLAYLERSRKAAEWCAARFGWLAVECAGAGEMRERLDVHREILGRLGY